MKNDEVIFYMNPKMCEDIGLSYRGFEKGPFRIPPGIIAAAGNGSFDLHHRRILGAYILSGEHMRLRPHVVDPDAAGCFIREPGWFVVEGGADTISLAPYYLPKNEEAA